MLIRTKLSMIVVIFWIRIHYLALSILLTSNRGDMPEIPNHFKFVGRGLAGGNRLGLRGHLHVSFRQLEVVGLLFWTVYNEILRSLLMRESLRRPVIIKIRLEFYWVVGVGDIVLNGWVLYVTTWLAVFWLLRTYWGSVFSSFWICQDNFNSITQPKRLLAHMDFIRRVSNRSFSKFVLFLFLIGLGNFLEYFFVFERWLL